MASATFVESCCVVKALTLPGNDHISPTFGSSEQHRPKKCCGQGYVIVPRRVQYSLFISSQKNMVQARFLGVKFVFPQVEVVVVVVGVAMVMVVVGVVVAASECLLSSAPKKTCLA